MAELSPVQAAAFKAKSIARGKLLERFRCHVQDIVDHADDEGDRVYFGSTNDFEYLKEIVSEMDMWQWDTVIKERAEIDPYAEMRSLRAECEKLKESIAAYLEEITKLRQVVSDCAAALPNGAHIEPSCSIEFMQGLPKEIALVVGGLLKAEPPKAPDDTKRLDFLDSMNRALNARYGTSYRWTLILNHNVNRLMLGHLKVDLNDAAACGLPSCRDAIDAEMRRIDSLPRVSP